MPGTVHQSRPCFPGLLLGLLASVAGVAGEFPVNQVTELDQERPALTQLVDGRIVTTWESEAGGTSAIRMRLFDTQGNSLGGEQLVFESAGQDQADPAIAALTDGGFVIAWSSRNGDGNDYSVAFQRYDANASATTGSPEQANTVAGGPQFQPQLAALPGGAFVVVWVAQDGGLDQDVMYRRFAPNTGSLDPTEFAANRLGTPALGNGDQGHARVAALIDGGFVIVFENRETGRVHGVRLDATGNALDAPQEAPGVKQFAVSQNVNVEYTAPTVAALNDGGFVVAMTASPDGLAGSRKVWVRKFDNEGTGADEFIAGSHPGRWEGPQVIGLPDGDFVVGWQAIGEGEDQPVGTWSVWLQQFQPDGVPRTLPMMVNEYNLGQQRRLALAPTASSGIGTVWQSFAQDGDRYGVFGKALAPQQILPGKLVIRRASPGTFHITFIGTGDRTHVLQRSQTLNDDWETIVTASPSSGTFTHVDDAGPAPSQKMFRAWTNP